MSRIQELLNQKRSDVAGRKAKRTPIVPEDDRRLRWNQDQFRIIAEIKRASVSAGSIRNIADPAAVARAYEQAGAAAISVLTEEHYFRGSLEDLTEIRKVVRVPILQKDFILDAYQILEAKEAGADFVLLIARFLTRAQITEFLSVCEQIQLNAIVEITDEDDLAKLTSPPPYLGVNSRDLETFEIDLARFERLRNKLPNAFLIAESGINSVGQLLRVAELGYHGALIGEHFLRTADPAKELERFAICSARVPRAELELKEPARGGRYKPRPQATKVKICGITNERDAMNAIEAGASALGFVFARESPRRITSEELHPFRNTITVPCVGVFRGNPIGDIREITARCRLDIAQIYDVDCDLNIPVWTARTLRKMDDLTNLQPGVNELVDIKLPDSQMESAWNTLRNKNTFALAGGLHSGNVARAVETCRPFWVDVARGVEMEPGKKDEEKMRNFIQAVYKA